MKNFIEGAKYLLRTAMGDTPVTCKRVYDNGSVSFFQYNESGTGTPIARYRMGSDGTIKGFHELTIIPDGIKLSPPVKKTTTITKKMRGVIKKKVVVKRKTNTPTTIFKEKADIESHKSKQTVMDAWKNDMASGWYRGFGNFGFGMEIHTELMFLYEIKRILENSNND